jgi:hypothetical protein
MSARRSSHAWAVAKLSLRTGSRAPIGRRESRSARATRCSAPAEPAAGHGYAGDVPTIENWNAEPIETASTAGGTLLVANVLDALMRPTSGAWPPPALVMQLGQGEPRSRFTDDLRAAVSAPLGHYCALQSINSEDTITWNFFGTLMHASEIERAAVLNWICGRLGLAWTDNTRCAIDLWRRIPHPYFPAADGPELDAVLDGDRCVIFIEAKWLSPEGTGRGPDGKRVGQMHLRQQFFERWGQALYGARGKLALSVGLRGKLTPDRGPDQDEIAVRSITWSELATCDAHPSAAEFSRYLAWKLAESPRARRHVPDTGP